MDSLKLNYDQNMDCALAVEYFEKRGGLFSLNLGPLTGNTIDTTDNYGNIIKAKSSLNDFKSNVWNSKLDAQVLNKIASSIAANAKLISQVEYLIRNIPLVETEKSLKIAVDYFQYHADLMPRFAISDFKKKLLQKSKSEVLYFCGNSTLWKFLYDTAVLLSLGFDVILQTETNTTVVSLLISDLFRQAGLPEDTFIVVPNIYVQITDTLQDYRNLCGTTFIVFESCDQDSAIDTIARALYPFDYTSTWSLKQIFVQESIHKSFMSKLTERVGRIESDDSSNGKLCDIASKLLNHTVKVMKHSVENEIQHVPMHPSFYTNAAKDAFKPLIMLDTCLTDNLWKCIDPEFEEICCMPVVGLQAFRTTKEAVNMINRLPSSALSVWCDKSAISTELTVSVNVSCIWINSYERINPGCGWTFDYPFIAPAKGGIAGLSRRFLSSKHTPIPKTKPGKCALQVEKATKLQVTWKSLTLDKRASTLIKAGIALNKVKNELIGKNAKNYTESSFTEAIAYINFAANMCNDIKNEFTVIDSKNTFTTMVEPLGVIGVGCKFEDIDSITRAIIAPLVFGNAIVLFTPYALDAEICKVFADCGLPVSSYVCEGHQGNDLLNYNTVKGVWYICDSSNFELLDGKLRVLSTTVSDAKQVAESRDLLESYFAKPKYIWETYGETFAN